MHFFINALLSKQRVKTYSALHYFSSKIHVKWTKGRWRNGWGRVWRNVYLIRNTTLVCSKTSKYFHKVTTQLLLSCKQSMCLQAAKTFSKLLIRFQRKEFCARRHSLTEITTCFDKGKMNVFMETSQRMITVDSSKTVFIKW